MNICIFGSGVVGSAVGKAFAAKGQTVVFYDVSSSRVAALEKEGFETTLDLPGTMENADAVFICVPTPSPGGKISLSHIRDAAAKIGKFLRNKDGYTLIAVKSTVVPKTCEETVLPLIEEHSGKKAGKDFGLCSNPEFLREAKALEDALNPDRIIIGEFDKRSGDALEKLYGGFSCPIIRTDLKTAEMAKYANNTFYAAKISFFNELHIICSKIGADSNAVRKIVQMDRFYGTHPWSHGSSFGGHCLPKDLNALIAFSAGTAGHTPLLLNAVREVNGEMGGAQEEDEGESK